MARRRARNQGCSGETPGGHRFPICAARPPRARPPAPLPASGPWTGLLAPPRAGTQPGAGRTGAGLRARGRGPPGAAAGGCGRSGLPSSADFMVPPAGAEGPKVSPLPQTAAGGPSGNLEGTGKLVLGIHAAAAAAGGAGGGAGGAGVLRRRAGPGLPRKDASPPADARRPGLSAARPGETS